MELKKYKLEECCLHITDGEHGSVNDDLQCDYYLLSNKNIINGNIVISKDDRKINKATFDKINKRILLEEKDVIISTVGTLGKTAIIEGNINYTFQRSVGIIKPNPQIIDSYYLKYLLDTDYYQQLLIGLSVGAVQKCIFIGTLKSLPISIPSLPTQKKIANILQALDQKIALNRAINDNLEAMSKQLYDYWFVQYDFPNDEGKPYKSSGGKMVWNEKLKREIPEGWEVKTIGTFADVKRGSTITKAQTVEGDIKVVAAATDYSFLHNEANRSAYVITVSASGANAGFINFWREPIYASDCSTIQCEKIEETLYCYYWILHFQELLFTQQIGAAQPHVYPEHINKIPIAVPSPDIFAKVKNLLVKSNQKQSEISREIESLTKQRDELLPLLMNGQVSLLNSD